jgi:hypothetical protein
MSALRAVYTALRAETPEARLPPPEGDEPEASSLRYDPRSGLRPYGPISPAAKRRRLGRGTDRRPEGPTCAGPTGRHKVVSKRRASLRDASGGIFPRPSTAPWPEP